MKTVISTNAAPGAIGPYSQAIDTGSMLFASGQIPINPATGEIPEGIKAQAAQSLANVKAILAAADMADFAAMNEVYAEAFEAPYPARSAVAVRTLPKGVLVEIEVIAVR